MARAFLFFVAAVVLVLGATAGPSWAEEDRVEVSVTEPMALEDFLKAVQKGAGIPMYWDPKSRALQNKQVIGSLRLVGTRAEVFEAVRGMLASYELVVIPVGAGDNTRYWIADARQTQSILRLKPTYIEITDENVTELDTQDGLFVTTSIKVKNLENLRDARNALNRLVTGQNIGNVTEVPAARAFVVTDFAPNVAAVYRQLREMDVPIAGRGPEMADREVVFEAIGLKHAAADDVAALLIQQLGANAPKPPGPRRPQPQQQYSADVPAQPEVRIAADPRLNQILVTGMRKDVQHVRDMIANLDRPSPVKKMHVSVVRLSHVDAIGAAAALSSLIGRAPTAWTAHLKDGHAPIVEAHPETNALLIHADEAATGILLRIVTELDQPKDDGMVGEGGGEGGGG